MNDYLFNHLLSSDDIVATISSLSVKERCHSVSMHVVDARPTDQRLGDVRFASEHPHRRFPAAHTRIDC